MEAISFVAASARDAYELAEIRVEAMRPSLEAVGRFDADRARSRFLSSFVPSDTLLIVSGDRIIGFYAMKAKIEYLYLDHLYVKPGFQGHGIGRQVVDQVKAEARTKNLPIRLIALRDSPANQFYLSCGFMLVDKDEFDNHYEWKPADSLSS